MTGLTRTKLQKLIEDVSKAAQPEHTTVLDLYQRRSGPAFFPTSLPSLDRLLHGGLPCGTVTEIAGPPGCGKTQFCIMFSVLSTLPPTMGGINGGVAYIDTESAFSAERLVEIARCRFPDYFGTNENLKNLCSRVHIYQESTCRQLQEKLDMIEEDIIKYGIKLIIVDSIASLVRKEFDSRLQGNMIERTSLLAKQAATLKYLAEAFFIPVVVTNQITTKIGQVTSMQADQHETERKAVLEDERGFVTAALGNTWGHSVNTRLVLQYRDGDTDRELIISKSPVSPAAQFVYSIKSEGIVLKGTEDGSKLLDLREGDPCQQKICVKTPEQVKLCP